MSAAQVGGCAEKSGRIVQKRERTDFILSETADRTACIEVGLQGYGLIHGEAVLHLNGRELASCWIGESEISPIQFL